MPIALITLATHTSLRNTLFRLALNLSLFIACVLYAATPVHAAVHATNEANVNNTLSPQTEYVRNPVFKGKTYLEQWGDPHKPSIILVHGLGDNGARDWQNVAPVLAKSYHVITFDLPGFGRSGKYNELYSPDNYARFIDWVAENYISDYDSKPFVLVGHSMGGVVALTYATQHPDKLKQLILIDAAGILHSAAFSKNLIDNYKPLWWTHLIPDSEALNQMLGFGLEDLNGIPAGINIALSTGITRKLILGGDPHKIAGLSMTQKNFSGTLGRLHMPTLLVWGDKDNIAPLRTGRMLKFLLPNAQLVIIPDSRHVPMHDAPDRLNSILWQAVSHPNTTITSGSQSAHTPQQDKHVVQNGTCDRQDEVSFSGTFDHLKIINCHNVTIENTNIKQLQIINSSVNIINSTITRAQGTALDISGSTVFATASKINIDRPIHVESSRLDFAGVNITAQQHAFRSSTSYEVTFSLCHIKSPPFTGYRHGVYKFTADPMTSPSPSQTTNAT